MAVNTDIERIKERIRKILMRTEDRGATPAEAVQAIEVAQKMLEKYNLRASDVSEPKQVEEKVQFTIKRPKSWTEELAAILAEAFECFSYRQKNRRGAVYVFSGPEHLAAVCCWLYRSVANELYNEATRSARDAGCRAHQIEQYRCSFLDSACASIYLRLHPASKLPALPALTEAEKRELLAECDTPPRKKCKRLTETQVLAMMCGMKFGKKVSLTTHAIGSPGEWMDLESSGI